MGIDIEVIVISEVKYTWRILELKKIHLVRFGYPWINIGGRKHSGAMKILKLVPKKCRQSLYMAWFI
jgi:hypothetical protein